MFVLTALRFLDYTIPRLQRPARSEPLRPVRAEGANEGLDAGGASVTISTATRRAWLHTILVSDTVPRV